MHLNLKRFWKDADWTIGLLFVDGVFQCFTLEPTEREIKIEGRTAIPHGTYKIKIIDSVRFSRKMPMLLDVPNFTGIEIHAGNTVFDTSACILTGEAVQSGYVSQSKAAFLKLFYLIENQTKLDITIEGL